MARNGTGCRRRVARRADGGIRGNRVIDATAPVGQSRAVAPRRATSRTVVIVAYDGVQALDVTGPHEVFAGATSVLGERPRPRAGYDVSVVARSAGPVRSESGLTLVAGALDAAVAPDTLIVPGGSGVRAAAADEVLVGAVGELAGRARRTVGVCSGAFLLAAAGLLSGRRATTHWARAASLAERHPDVRVDVDPIWVRDGDVWTSAGVTAGIDVSLALVEDDHGVDVADTVARWLVMFLRRPGGQRQFAAPVWRTRARHDPVRRVQDLIDADPAADLRVGVLATRAAMSERHFLRRFTAEVGLSPARYVAAARVESARRELEQTRDTVAAIAVRVGFGTSESMRRTFVRHLGTSPDEYRRHFTHATERRPA
jgi:transcriptional regulator GlxA family with amidase domain